MPKVDAKVIRGSGTIEADSDEKVYTIPAIGISAPIGKGPRAWRFGLAAYGVSGLGVDYRGSNLDNPNGLAPDVPLIAGEFTQLQIMKFAPALSFQASDTISLGVAAHVDYSSLDLRSGSSFNYGIGGQAGLIWKPIDMLSIGLNYVSAQNVKHENVIDFDQDGIEDDLELEAPQQAGLGLAFHLAGGRLLLEADGKWLNWADAKGYKDFDWKDQWVYGVGLQFEATDSLILRAGYNYGENPVEDHSGFVGNPMAPGGLTNVQGHVLPTYYYETFRWIGFPAVVESHIAFGLGYQFSEKFQMDLGFMWALENTVSESGTDLTGQPVTLESTLSETSLDFGLTWRF
jgi:long-chain fatty acid transport protein